MKRGMRHPFNGDEEAALQDGDTSDHLSANRFSTV
jgi:hypothetical protein